MLCAACYESIMLMSRVYGFTTQVTAAMPQVSVTAGELVSELAMEGSLSRLHSSACGASDRGPILWAMRPSRRRLQNMQHASYAVGAGSRRSREPPLARVREREHAPQGQRRVCKLSG